MSKFTLLDTTNDKEVIQTDNFDDIYDHFGVPKVNGYYDPKPEQVNFHRYLAEQNFKVIFNEQK